MLPRAYYLYTESQIKNNSMNTKTLKKNRKQSSLEKHNTLLYDLQQLTANWDKKTLLQDYFLSLEKRNCDIKNMTTIITDDGKAVSNMRIY